LSVLDGGRCRLLDFTPFFRYSSDLGRHHIVIITASLQITATRHTASRHVAVLVLFGVKRAMSLEIERKFLVRSDDWRALASSHMSIRQAYLASDGKASIRVRTRGDGTATLTIKSRPVDLRRLELEYDIPILEAEALMQLRQGAIIEKVRYLVPNGELTWEVDVFSGENLGLVVAEIELPHEHQHVELPPWIGTEVTGQPQYYNSSLVQRPFCSWSRRDTPTPIEKLA
jgi:adenylate cyclase